MTNGSPCVTAVMPASYNIKSIDTYRHDIHNSSETFHSQFLNTLFKAFLFPEAAMAQLDAVLTVVNTDLVGFTTSNKSESESLSHLINLTTCEKNAFDIWEAHAHFFLLTIDMGSMHSVWKSGKSSHEKTEYSFHLSYLDAHSAMNNQLVIDKREAIQGYLDKMLDGQLARVEKAVSPKVIVDASK